MPYTTSKADTGLGSILAIGATPTTVGEVKSMKLSGRKWDTDDVTNMQSTQKEFITSIQDTGEWAIDGNKISGDAGQVLVETAFASGALTAFTVTLAKAPGQVTTGDKYTFSALVTENDASFELSKANTFSLKLKVSGTMTFVAGA